MFCHKCGYELPEGAKFCSKCGTAQSDVAGSSHGTAVPKKESVKYKIDTTKRIGVIYDPYKDDPRFIALLFYEGSRGIASMVSSAIILYIYLTNDTMMEIYYEAIYRYGYHTATWGFVVSSVIWTLVCFAIAAIVSYMQLKKHFHSSRAAIAIILCGKLEVNETKFTNIDDDIEFVSYFMNKYGKLFKQAWILPIGVIVLTAFIIPRII